MWRGPPVFGVIIGEPPVSWPFLLRMREACRFQMKKLLALILCVMMFVAVIPTAAFAAGTQGAVPATSGATAFIPGYLDKAVAAKAIKDIGKDMNAMYGALVADQTVFGTAQTIYTLTDGLAKSLLEDVASAKNLTTGNTIYTEDLVENIRVYLNYTISDEIAAYMNKRQSAFTNGDGYIQPDKYLTVFGKAVSDALTSEKAQKNIEAIVVGLAALKLQQSVNDGADDLYTAIKEWDHWAEFPEFFDQLPNPDGAYWTAWLPANTMLVPTGSTALATDASLANSALWYVHS